MRPASLVRASRVQTSGLVTSDFFLSIVTFLGVLVPGGVFIFLCGPLHPCTIPTAGLRAVLGGHPRRLLCRRADSPGGHRTIERRGGIRCVGIYDAGDSKGRAC
jgi:hypothetical protein